MLEDEFEKTIRRALVKLRDGTRVEVEYVLVIDWERIRQLAERALRNKSRRSMFGPVTAHIAGPVNKNVGFQLLQGKRKGEVIQ